MELESALECYKVVGKTGVVFGEVPQTIASYGSTMSVKIFLNSIWSGNQKKMNRDGSKMID
jgi:hypothetical protein